MNQIVREVIVLRTELSRLQRLQKEIVEKQKKKEQKESKIRIKLAFPTLFSNKKEKFQPFLIRMRVYINHYDQKFSTYDSEMIFTTSRLEGTAEF